MAPYFSLQLPSLPVLTARRQLPRHLSAGNQALSGHFELSYIEVVVWGVLRSGCLVACAGTVRGSLRPCL